MTRKYKTKQAANQALVDLYKNGCHATQTGNTLKYDDSSYSESKRLYSQLTSGKGRTTRQSGIPNKEMPSMSWDELIELYGEIDKIEIEANQIQVWFKLCPQFPWINEVDLDLNEILFHLNPEGYEEEL